MLTQCQRAAYFLGERLVIWAYLIFFLAYQNAKDYNREQYCHLHAESPYIAGFIRQATYGTPHRAVILLTLKLDVIRKDLMCS